MIKKRATEWPLNLFREVLSKREIELLPLWEIGLECILISHLSKEESEILYFYYRDGLTMKEIEVYTNTPCKRLWVIRKNIIRKLRSRQAIEQFKSIVS